MPYALHLCIRLQIVRVIDLSTLRLLQPDARGLLGKSTPSMADKEVVTFKGPVLSLDFSPEDSWLCVGASDNKVTLWRVSDGECYQTFEGHTDGVTSVRFSPDGMMILSASYDGTAKIWRVSDGHLNMSLEEHSSFVSGAEYGEKGQLVATGGGDRLVLIWDAEEGKVVHRLEGHESWVLAVAFAPRDHILASCGADNLVLLWDALAGSRLAELRAHSDWVETLAFDPTGSMLATAGHDRDILVWDVTEPTAPTIRQTLKGRRLWPALSSLYFKAIDISDWLSGKHASPDDDEQFGVLDALTDHNAEHEDPKLEEIASRVEGHFSERAMALVRDDVLGLSVREQVALATLFLQYAGEDGRVPKNAYANACMKDLMVRLRLLPPASRDASPGPALRSRQACCAQPHRLTPIHTPRHIPQLPPWACRTAARPAARQLKQLLAKEDEEHRTAEQKLRERAPHVTWEEVLGCFEAHQTIFEGHGDSYSDGFRINVLGF